MFGLSCILVMLLSVPNHFHCFASDSSAECSDEGSHTTYNSSEKVLLNSSLNPVVFGWKMKEVRQIIKNDFKNFMFWKAEDTV